MILEKIILEGSLILKKNGIKTSRLDSEILMSKTINKDRVFMILNSNLFGILFLFYRKF